MTGANQPAIPFENPFERAEAVSRAAKSISNLLSEPIPVAIPVSASSPSSPLRHTLFGDIATAADTGVPIHYSFHRSTPIDTSSSSNGDGAAGDGWQSQSSLTVSYQSSNDAINDPLPPLSSSSLSSSFPSLAAFDSATFPFPSPFIKQRTSPSPSAKSSPSSSPRHGQGHGHTRSSSSSAAPSATTVNGRYTAHERRPSGTQTVSRTTLSSKDENDDGLVCLYLSIASYSFFHRVSICIMYQRIVTIMVRSTAIRSTHTNSSRTHTIECSYTNSFTPCTFIIVLFTSDQHIHNSSTTNASCITSATSSITTSSANTSHINYIHRCPCRVISTCAIIAL
jgi:hypothetical protein